MKKSTVILWIIAVLFLICSLSFFPQGKAQEGICGVVIAIILFVIGLRKKAAPAPIEEAKETPAQPASTASASKERPAVYTQENFDFLRTKVAGVTFKNGRKSRQTILRKIHFHDEPFSDDELEMMVERGEYEGKPAFGVFVNGEQIGNIPAEHVPFVSDNFSRLDGITNLNVYGGGDHNYGAEVILRFRKET